MFKFQVFKLSPTAMQLAYPATSCLFDGGLTGVVFVDAGAGRLEAMWRASSSA